MSNEIMYTCLLGNTFFIARRISFASVIRAMVTGVGFKDTDFETGTYLLLIYDEKITTQKQQ